MVQWSDPAVQARVGVIDMNITFLLLGLYGWEYLSSLDVEYAVLRGRLAFRWPLVSYIVGRVFTFIFLIMMAIQSNPPSPNVFCLPTALFTALVGDIGLGCTSINLMARTWVIWKESRLVHFLLLCLVIAHWIMLALDVANLQGVMIGNQCAIIVVHPSFNGAVLIYSLFFDFFVLVLCIVGLSGQTSKSPLSKRLRAQGLVYFVVASVTYIPPTVFAILAVNSLISLTGLAALCASNIASCRVVRSLLGLRSAESSQVTEEPVETGIEFTSQIRIQTANTVA